jgi:glycosyltransferase involved in cell wall biosynthesis
VTDERTTAEAVQSEAAASTVRVLVNALHARTGGGVTYLRNMLPRLAADPELDVHLCLHGEQAADMPGGDAVTAHLAACGAGFYTTLIWEQFGLPRLARRIGADVVFSPANFGPLWAPRPVVLLRNALDVGKTEKRIGKRLYWAVLSLMTTLSLRRAPAAIAVSDYARKALTRHVPERVADRVSVIPHGVDETFSPPPAEEAREDFLLAVGDLYVQKNFLALIEAMARLAVDRPGLCLKIAGRPIDPEYAAALEWAIAERGLGDAVELLGHVAPPDIAALYRRCAVFVFPSLVETFGNPLVEAMACGAPIVCSDAAAMPEVVGEAALLFDPGDVDALTARLQEVLADPDLQRDLGLRAQGRAKNYSWDETARRTATVLKASATA